jgi:steroid delta-isomerase-like uncharacterized protein
MRSMESEFFSRYMDAWNRHDFDELLRFVTEDCTYADVALDQSSTGKDAIREFFVHVETRFSSDYAFEPGHLVATDAGYALEWVMKGTHDRSGPQLQATGKPYRIRGVSVGELRDGRISRNTDYWSLAELLIQIGLMPLPAAAS